MEYNIKDLENKIIKCKNKQIEEIDIKEIDDFEDIKVDENKIGKEKVKLGSLEVEQLKWII